ncbi:hypothetical protein ACWEKM_37765 [Streptomyces sp. NPDC004752]
MTVVTGVIANVTAKLSTVVSEYAGGVLLQRGHGAVVVGEHSGRQHGHQEHRDQWQQPQDDEGWAREPPGDAERP